MRLAAFWREIGRNLASGTSRLAGFQGIAAIGVGVLILAESMATIGVLQEVERYRGSGASVITLAASGRVDGRACERLIEVPGVVAAGALKEATAAAATVLEGEPLDLHPVSPSFPAVLGARPAGRGIIVASDVAEAIGPGPVGFGTALTPVAGTYLYPSDGRRGGFGWAVLAPRPAGHEPFDECWVDVWPQRNDIRRLLTTALTPPIPGDGSEPPRLSQVNTSHGTDFDGDQRFGSRATRFAPLVSTALGLLLAIFAVWMRRVEVASTLHLGARRLTVCAQHLIEVAAWAVSAAGIAWVTGFVFAVVVAPVDVGVLTLRALEIAVSSVGGALAGGVIGLSLIREHRLWRYVKAR